MDKQSILSQIDALEQEAFEIELSKHASEMAVEIEAIKQKHAVAARSAVSGKYEELKALVNQIQEPAKSEARIIPTMTQPTTVLR